MARAFVEPVHCRSLCRTGAACWWRLPCWPDKGRDKGYDKAHGVRLFGQGVLLPLHDDHKEPVT